MLRVLFLTVTIFLLGNPIPPASAQENPDTSWIEIRGTVLDVTDGSGLARVQLDLPGLQVSVITDEGGRFQFPPLPKGRHRLIVRKLGYRTEDGDFSVDVPGSFSIRLAREDPDFSELGNVVGTVSERGSGRGVELAEVHLEPLNQIRRTDRLGQFDYMNLPPGHYTLRVEALGYAVREASLAVADGKTLEVKILMAVKPLALEGITVSAQSRFLESAGFFRRQGKGYDGRQWGREEIQTANVMFLEDIVTLVPGIRATRDREGKKVIMGRGRCRMKLYVDDFLMEGFDLANLDPNSIEAMEAYQGGGDQIPIEYGMKPFHCGVILVWLKH